MHPLDRTGRELGDPSRWPSSESLFSRRSLLRRAGVGAGLVAASPLLAACGDSGTGQAASGEIGGELNLYTWEGYDAPDAMAAWRRKNKVDVKTSSYIGIQDDVQTRIKSPAGKGIDLSSVNQAYIEYYKELGILSPITEDEVPALRDLYPVFDRAPYRNDDGTFNCVPWVWGILGLTYSPDRLERPDSWNVLLEPRLKGRVTMLDDAHQNILLAAIILGYDPDRLTHEQLKDVKDWLTRLVEQVNTFTPTIGDYITLLASGEVDAVYQGWNATDLFIQEQDARAKTVVPREGGLGFNDAMFIPADADNRATALDWCQTLSDGKAAAAIYNSVAGGASIPQVVPLLDPETRELFPYDDLEPLFEKVRFPLGLARGDSEYVTFDEAVKTWNEIKARAG